MNYKFLITILFFTLSLRGVSRRRNNLGIAASGSTPPRNDEAKRSNLFLCAIIIAVFAFYLSPVGVSATSGSVLDFDGNDYLVASDNSVFDQADRLSISVWAKPDVAGDDYILYRSGAYYLKLTSSSTIEGAIYYSAAFHTVTSSAITVDSLTWTHIEMTYDKTDGKLKIFLNGELDNSADYSTSVPSAVTALYIGAENATPENCFDGKIDDVRLYQYARSISDVRMDYNDGLAVRFASPRRSFSEGGEEGCDIDPASCMDYGLVGYWNMDEGSGTTAYDASDNSNDGTLTDGPKWTEGKEGGGLQFDGVDDYVLINHSSSLIPDTLTVTGWMYLTKEVHNLHIVSKWGCYALRLSNQAPKDTLTFTIWDENTEYSTIANNQAAAFDYNKWVYVSGTYDGTTVKLYLNGIYISAVSNSHSGDIDDDATNIQFGRYQGGSFFYGGSIDEVRIYNRALTAEEVRYHYNRGGPVAHWKFDEGDGQTAYDETSNNNDGTLGATTGENTDDPSWVEGKFGGALDFDGTDDYVAKTSLSPDFDEQSTISISLWVNPSGNTGTDYFISFPEASTYNGIDMRWDGTNFLVDLVTHSDDSTGVLSTAGSVGNWYHLVLTYDGTTLKFYKNGVEVGSDSVTVGIGLKHATKEVNIGRFSSNGAYFNGSIDDVRIYNYARSPLQILQDYNNGLAAHLK